MTIITTFLSKYGAYKFEEPIEIDLQEIREKGICAFKPDKPGVTYDMGISDIWEPAEKHKLDYDAIVSTPALCTLCWQYMTEATYQRSGYVPERAEIEAVVDGSTSEFPVFKRHDFWTLKYVAVIASVEEVKESEVFLINFDLADQPERQVYMVGWKVY